MQSPSASSPLPLFDRFANPPQDSHPAAIDQLRASLRCDLTRLFNTRNALTIAQFMGDTPSPFNYGMPDTLTLSAQSAPDLQRWELVVTRAIALYEPRLIQLRVKVAPVAHQPAAVHVTISAMAQLSGQLCQFAFETRLD
ncbi:MAG: type VI secretion system baseplate subunit TssE [Pseudomonadota bacterium]|nr:type VI secretion system baseplate subunit TssE [Pseudomonadota bacterium]